MKAFSLSCVVDSEEYFDGNESRVNTWITAAIGTMFKISACTLNLVILVLHTKYLVAYLGVEL